MTITEQILDLIEINEEIPALVINEYANVVAVNNCWSQQLGNIESGKSIFNFFDKSTSLLVKSSLIDSKTFLRIKNRTVQFLINEKYENYHLVISPFKIDNKIFFYILSYNDEHKGNFIVYPTIDDLSYYKKFDNIFELLTSNKDFKSIESDLKYLIEIGKEPIAIRNTADFVLMNESFKEFINPEIIGLELSLNSKLKNSELLLTISTCAQESLKNKSLFIIENPFVHKTNITDTNKILIFPISEKYKTIIFGKIILDEEILSQEKIQNKPEEISHSNSAAEPIIIYDKDDFEILDINEPAAEIFGYDIDEIKSKNFIELFVPDDVQKLLSFVDKEKTFNYKQVKKDGSTVNIIAEREKILWGTHEAFSEKIKIADELKSNNSDLIKGEIHTINPNATETSESFSEQNESESNEIEVLTENEENNFDEGSEYITEIAENESIFHTRDLEKNESDEILVENVKEEIPSEKVYDEKKNDDEIINKNSGENLNETIKEELTTPLKEPKKETPKSQKSMSPFLTSLFHELLTPVNVILGFVQEIIDSVEEPTEEQKESSEIIKENQQLLLQTMNTAVQYVKLDENILPLNLGIFDLKNSIADLENSISKTAENKNVKVIFSKVDQILINNDKQKLLAAVSYLIKFFIAQTNSNEINVGFVESNDRLNITLKDKGNITSKEVLENLLNVYNSSRYDVANSLGLSQISIKLSKKLNEIISAKVLENSDVLTLSIPLNLDKSDLEDEIVEKINIEPKKTEDPNRIEKTSESELKENDNLIKNYNLKVDEDFSEKSDEILDVPESITEIDGNGIEDYDDDEIGIIESIPFVENLDEPNEILKSDEDDKIDFDISDLTCLFIDDSVDSQYVFKSQMSDFKEISICRNFTEAIPLLEKNKFDVIYVDINLNDVYNGFDALKIIRQFKNYRSVPVFAVSAYSFNDDHNKFIDFGFSDYFVKPLQKEQLLSSLKNNLL